MTTMSVSLPPQVPKNADHAQLGALVRQRREEYAGKGISMDALAELAKVGRSTLHRLEHGSDIQPQPAKLARVLAALSIGSDEVVALLDPSEWRDEVVMWLNRLAQLGDVNSELARHGVTASPDLVALRPDGSVVTVEVKAGAEDHGERVAEVQGALQSLGYLVTRPV